ncbi:hypothetical protein AAGG74_19250 [Bacillus mexicanus]|uniref:hypothetical protein n=1 Tax=Bacillus mexicanus TaxID=2834415 RepID=UPI003D1B1159
MKVKFTRTIFKKAVDICRKICDNKSNPQIWIRSFTDTDVLFYTQRDDKGIKYFHHIKTNEPLEKEISFVANPTDMSDLAGGKIKELDLTFSKENDDDILISSNGKKAIIKHIQGKFPLEKLPYISMKDPDLFISLIEDIVKFSSKEVNSIEIGGYEVSIKTPIYFKRFNLVEDFPKFIFPLDYIEQLKKHILWTKSTVNQMSQCSKKGELYIRVENKHKKNESLTVRQLFILNQRDSFSPSIKQRDEEIVETINLDAEDLYEILSDYPAAVNDVYLYDNNGDLMIDPYDKKGEPLDEDEIHPIYKLKYEGKVKKTKINRIGLSALVGGYKGNQKIDIIKYKNDEGENEEVIFAFRIYDKNIYSLVLAKNEPNYIKVQNKLDKYLEYEKTLTFLNE